MISQGIMLSDLLGWIFKPAECQNCGAVELDWIETHEVSKWPDQHFLVCPERFPPPGALTIAPPSGALTLTKSSGALALIS